MACEGDDVEVAFTVVVIRVRLVESGENKLQLAGAVDRVLGCRGYQCIAREVEKWSLRIRKLKIVLCAC